MQISSFRKKISSVNSQLSKEINFEIIFRTCSILRNSAEEISLMERCDWSIGECLQTSNEVSTMLLTWLSINQSIYFVTHKHS